MLKPKYDDRQIRTIINQSIVSQAMLVAHDINLFERIGNHKKTLDEICELVSLPKKSAFALLTLCIHSKLIMLKSGFYQLTPYAKEYLWKESPFYFGDVLDLIIQQNAVRSYSSIRAGLISGTPQIYGEGELFKVHENDGELLESFVKAMHAKSLAPALFWPDLISINNGDIILDIGGGVGTHTIYACMRWPKLKGIIYEKPEVCTFAKKYLSQYQLEDRVVIQEGDMWKDTFPMANMHFYSDIFHDWPEEKVHWLSKKSFDSLPSKGKIVIHEMLFDKQKIETFNVAAYNLNMLLWTHGQQFSGEELKAILKRAGFMDIEVYKTFGDWSLMIGYKY